MNACHSRRLAVASAVAIVSVAALDVSAAWAAPPPCTQMDLIGVVQDGFDAVQQFELKSKRRLAAVDEIKDLGVVEHALVVGKYDVSRFCQGRARLADGEAITVWFRIYAQRRGKDGEFGAVRPCFAKYNPAHIGDCSQDDAAVKPR